MNRRPFIQTADVVWDFLPCDFLSVATKAALFNARVVDTVTAAVAEGAAVTADARCGGDDGVAVVATVTMELSAGRSADSLVDRLTASLGSIRGRVDGTDVAATAVAPYVSLNLAAGCTR